MMSWLGASLLFLGFFALLYALRLAHVGKKAILEAHGSMAVIRSKELSEDEKEKLLQRSSLQLIKYFFLLSVGGALAVALPALVVWGMSQVGWLQFDEVMARAMSWEFITVSSVVAIVAALVIRSIKGDV